MVKANVIPGKFLSCLLGIFIGILLTLGGLVGGGFYVYKNVKVGSLLGLLPQETDNWLSDEYAQNTIEGLVKELQSLANGDITLEKVTQISPYVGDMISGVLDNVNQNGIVTLDRGTRSIRRRSINLRPTSWTSSSSHLRSIPFRKR